MPLAEQKLVFGGKAYVTKNASQEQQVGEFRVTFNQLIISIIRKANSTFDTDVEYKNFDVSYYRTNSYRLLFIINNALF